MLFKNNSFNQSNHGNLATVGIADNELITSF